MLLLSVSWCFLIFSWFKVLLKFPTILTILFATTCLGSLSNVYKRAQQEVPLSCLLFNIQISREKFSVCLTMFCLTPHFLTQSIHLGVAKKKTSTDCQTLDVSTRIAQLGLRLLSDTMALMLVDPGEPGRKFRQIWHSGRVWKLWKISAMLPGVSKAKLKEKLQSVLQKVAPSQQEHEVIAVKVLDWRKGALQFEQKTYLWFAKKGSLEKNAPRKIGQSTSSRHWGHWISMVSVNTFGTPEMQMYEMQPYK